MADFEFTRGDTFSASCVYKDANGVVVDITGMSIACSMLRDGAGLAFDVTITDALNGVFTLDASASATAALEPGTYKADIEYTVGAVVNSTDVFKVKVLEDVTNAN